MQKLLKQIIYQTEGKFTDELALADSPLGRLPKRLLPDGVKGSICGYCSTGCQLNVHIKDGKAVNLTPNPAYPVNLSEACPKGWEALTPLKAKDRATKPLLRKENGKFEEVSWDKACEVFVNRFNKIHNTYGQDSTAFISTGQIPTEEMFFLGALAKFGMGILHGDGNTRQCMATAVVAYKQAFGFDAPPYTYKDFEESDVLVFVGANPCIAHPIMWQRVEMNPHHPKIITIDPRKTETAMRSTHHYALKPKSDLILFYGIAHLLIKNQWIDVPYIKKHVDGFIDFAEHVEHFTPEMVSEATGLSVEQLKEFTQMIHEGKRVSFWWTMGVNQGYEAVRTAQAMINIALITGNIGRPGTGANSITGQCNAMGSRLFSNTTNLLGGHDFTNADHRTKIAQILDIDVTKIPDTNSLAYDQIIEGVMQDKIKGLWVIATNPAHSWINKGQLLEYRKNLDFLVVQDMYHSTETAQIADLILPAAGWGEKEGTFINSERRIGRIQKVAAPPGEALSDFDIFKKLAHVWGCGRLFRHFKTPEDVFMKMKECSKGQPCDITGIRDYQMIEESGGIQWPLPEGKSIDSSERRLFEDGKFYHKDGKAKLLFSSPRPKPERLNEKYPFELLTGRGTSSQWHTQTRTSKSKVLRKLYPQEVYVEINSDDGRELGLMQGQWVFVSTRRGKVKAQVAMMPSMKRGQLFMPMHYEETNYLTFPSFDPYSRQPSYKTCAARISQI